MKNQEIAKLFYEISQFLEIEGVAFKPFAYTRAALSLEALKEDVAQIYIQKGKDGLLEIPGVGKNIAFQIEEYLKTGNMQGHQELKKKLPLKIDELMKVEGLGPKKIKVLYEKLGIKDLNFDVNEINSCSTSADTNTAIVERRIELEKTNIYGTPLIFINNKGLVGSKPYRVYERILNGW